jgi:hypothetical protein
VSDLFVAQMIGHSSSSILQTYARVIDDSRRDAIRKLEDLRQSQSLLTQVGSRSQDLGGLGR